jgi:hypothetical protein
MQGLSIQTLLQDEESAVGFGKWPTEQPVLSTDETRGLRSKSVEISGHRSCHGVL